ncbi:MULTISPECIES: Na+/H+ antiporter subunit E [Phascolarctobacterium]|uniref:Na+/H+ antiporter subunit E n=1 Tax=Phascolarctobacterium TaxID=33024 RepID=UPI001B3265FD|nr:MULTISPECIES: Na+/H+ antiporter subunit E [Phascolarctobacterium]QTV78756.1 Na+/H+ antiporter subunit E [Phascolarctobacterium sp. Marseille-Q4147]
MEKQGVLNDKKIVGSPMVHMTGLALVLFAFWMVLSGRTETKFVVYGILTAVVTTWVTYPLLLVPNKDGSKKYYVFGFSIPKMIMYFFWLMWQLVLANIDVLLATTGQELNIDPKVVRFRFRADNPMASVILANSITLTPGTVTMNVTDDGVYEIHALTVGAAAGVLDGGMQKKVADLYGEKFDFAVVESEE